MALGQSGIPSPRGFLPDCQEESVCRDAGGSTALKWTSDSAETCVVDAWPVVAPIPLSS